MICYVTRLEEKKSRIPATTVAGFGRPRKATPAPLLCSIGFCHNPSHKLTSVPWFRAVNRYELRVSASPSPCARITSFIALPLVASANEHMQQMSKYLVLLFCALLVKSRVMGEERERDARGKASCGWLWLVPKAEARLEARLRL